MKLKMYRISLITFLSLSAIITLIFGIISTINVVSFEKEKMMDGIIYIVCFSMLLIFTCLEIFNTIISFKNGSVYIKGLAYDDNNNINRNSQTISGGIAAFSIFAIIYVTIVISGINLPLSTLDIEALYFIITTSILVGINALAVVLFPLLAYDDQSLIEGNQSLDNQ